MVNEPTCEKCHGTGERTAVTRSFEYEGHSLRCLAFVSSCMVCGHRWEDEAHSAANSRQVELACRAASVRPPISNGDRNQMRVCDAARVDSATWPGV